MLNGGIVVFFYVDDIVFCHRTRDKEKVDSTIAELQKKFQLNVIGDLKWFLGIHVLRDRRQKKLWLSQTAFIEKIANMYGIDTSGRMPDTPMKEYELLPATTEVDPSSALRYQRKTGSILYTAITTRPDVAFAVSRLARFNQNPNEEHHHAVNKVIY